MKPFIKTLPSGKIAIYTPYHPEVVRRFNRKSGLMGTWDPDAKAWILRAEHREKAQAVIDELWPPETALIDVVVTYRCNYHTERPPTLDGLDLFFFSRDYVGNIRHPGVIEVIKNTLKSGGSRNHPTVAGSLIVKAKVRPSATAEWNAYEAIAEIKPADVAVTA